MKPLICAFAGLFLSGSVWAESPAKPPTVALVAAVGDQVDVVRQRPSTGSHREPFIRKSFPVNGQALNLAVLRGLDRAIEDEEPQARRVLLAWSPPADVLQKIAAADGKARGETALQALKSHLADMPARAEWDRIEAIVPGYIFSAIRGMGRKQSGLGFYVQPLSKSAISLDGSPDGEVVENVAVSEDPAATSDFRTVNPHTGEVGRSPTYLAVYMYFRRITLDARTLEVIATKDQYDNIKYADPMSTALDIADQFPLKVMAGKLLALAEDSAYTSVRGKAYVSTTAPRPVQPAASAP